MIPDANENFRRFKTKQRLIRWTALLSCLVFWLVLSMLAMWAIVNKGCAQQPAAKVTGGTAKATRWITETDTLTYEPAKEPKK